MRSSKVIGWTITILGILFLVWMAEVVLGLAVGLLGLLVSLLGGLISLAFSKAGLTLIAIGLIIYILTHRSREKRHYYDY